MRDENSHLRNVLRAGATEPPPSDDEAGLPSPGERQYLAHARPANKPLYSIHFISPAGDVKSFQYVHLDSNTSYAAESISLKFLGMEPVRVVIHGRNLWRLYDYIHQHRCAWVVQAPRSFAEDGQTIVTQIQYTAVKEEE